MGMELVPVLSQEQSSIGKQVNLGPTALSDLQAHIECTICKEANKTSTAVLLCTEKSKQALVHGHCSRAVLNPG